jgi:hypothetical protein
MALTPLTESVAEAGDVALPMLLDTLVKGMIFTKARPALAAVVVTCTVIVHCPATPPDDAATDPPLSVTIVEPGVATTDPPQLFDNNPKGPIDRPVGDVGKLSVRLTDVASVAVLLKIWIVSVDVPTGGTLAGLNDLLTSNCALACAGSSEDSSIVLTTKLANRNSGDAMLQKSAAKADWIAVRKRASLKRVFLVLIIFPKRELVVKAIRLLTTCKAEL